MVFWFAYLTRVDGTGGARRVFLSFKAAMADHHGRCVVRWFRAVSFASWTGSH